MKQILLFVAFFTLSFGSLIAQSNTLAKPAELWQKKLNQPAILDIGAVNHESPRPVAFNPNAVTSRASPEVIVGNSTYDLQSNSSCATRIYNHGDGTLSTIWTQGFDAGTGYPNRGTGYNYYDGSEWMGQPTQRLEASIRTGWPSIAATGDGDEVIVNHIFQAPFQLHSLSTPQGTSAWTEMGVPNNTPAGVVWPRIAAGGSDGNTIHAVAITPPVANGGTVYEGVDGHILYYRSLDGGVSWDIQDAIIPGLDNTVMNSGTADSYAIDANGETVVIAHFGQFHDVDIFKSIDNGETWTETTVLDFPLDNYIIDSGYSVDDLPPFDSLVSPDPLAILTSDQSGALVLDNNDVAHVFFGQMYVADEDLADGGSTFYPATSGLAYWNENYGEDSISVIADVIDANGNGIIDIASIDDIASYFTSLTSFPSAGVDADNNIYVSYSAVMEEYLNLNALPNQQHMRHLFAIASNDGGETWTTPYNLINEEIATEPDLIPTSEAVFPSVAKLVDNTMHILYQLDFEPGLSVRGDADPAGTNFLSYIGLDTDMFGFTNAGEEIKTLSVKISPNPMEDQFSILIDLKETVDLALGVYNLMGELVYQEDLGKYPAGQFSKEIEVNELPKGAYFIEIIAGGNRQVTKVLKH